MVDLASLALMVALGVPARGANLPSLLLGAVVQFVGNRRFVFARARDGSLARQLVLFALTEVVALGLNALVYDLVAQRVLLGVSSAVLVRVAVSSAVFLGWSYPVWRRVFAGRRDAETAPG